MRLDEKSSAEECQSLATVMKTTLCLSAASVARKIKLVWMSPAVSLKLLADVKQTTVITMRFPLAIAVEQEFDETCCGCPASLH
jgi:hypothetical protein